MDGPLLTVEIYFDADPSKEDIETITSLIDKKYRTRLDHDGYQLVLWQIYDNDEATYKGLKEWFEGEEFSQYIAEQAAVLLDSSVSVHVTLDWGYDYGANGQEYFSGEADEATYARRVASEYRAANDMFPD